MGSLLHFFDFKQGSTSRKSLTHKKHVEGLEAPRNSLELPIQTSQSFDAVGDNIPHSYQVKHISSKHNCYPGGTPMKKLIEEEISKEPDVRRNVPSVVARLMGMDMLPSETKPTIHVKGKKNENTRGNFTRTEQTQNGSTARSPLGLKNSKQTERDVSSHRKKEDPDQLSNSLKFEKPRPREHPQEELLQKFKKEFEAWQAARVWEHSKNVEGSIPQQWLAQEHFQKEKVALYAVSKKVTTSEKPVELRGHAPKAALKTSSQESQLLKHHEYRRESFEEVQKESFTLRNRSKSRHVEQGLMNNRHHEYRRESSEDEENESLPFRNGSRTRNVEQVLTTDHDDKQSAPTRIVILKPGPDRITSSGHSWAGSSEIVEEEGSIEDFLEEVKERLRFEMQGKSAKRDLVARGSGIETPFSEKPSSPKQIARSIAKQARDSVTRDLEMNLVRSRSTRSYRSEVQVNESSSPEFLDRDTRKLLSQRLRNVLKEENYLGVPNFSSGSFKASMLGDEVGKLRTLDVLKRGNYRENLKDELELQSTSFRLRQQNELFHMGEMSPRNLVRSMSAPVSGTSFGKLLLEDRHVLTGAQIRRRHESAENVSVEVRKNRKEKFNFRGKVSNFRYKFTLKSRLFGRKIQSMEESWSNQSGYIKDMMSGPTVVTNLGSSQENSTEVPPSPASVSSSIHEDFYRTVEHPSPISPLDVPMIEDHAMPQAFRDISSNLHELRKQLHQLEFGVPEDMTKVKEPSVTDMVELEGEGEGEAEAYIKNLLIVSGLYDGTNDQLSSRWDQFSKLINTWVFDKVEESYRKRPEEDETTKDHNESKVDHKVLFDLLNEALPVILGPSVTMSSFKRNVIGPTKKRIPHHKELLDEVWRMIRIYVYPPCEGNSFDSLDSMVARDLSMTPWSDMIHDDVNIIGRELENLILGDLIEETLRDILL